MHVDPAADHAIINRVTPLASVIAVYMLLSFSLLIQWPPPLWDEEIFADTGRTLLQHGHFGTLLIRGMEGHVFWQPPGYFFLTALITAVSGFHLEAFRTVSVLVGGGIIVAAYAVARRASLTRNMALLSAFFLAVNPLFINAVKFARMDGVCVLFTLIALILLLDGRIDFRRSLIVGIVLTGAVFFHPLGVIGVGASVVHLLFFGQRTAKEKLVHSAGLLIPLILMLSVFALYASRDLADFVLQLTYQLQRKLHSPLRSFGNMIERYHNLPADLLLVVGGCASFLFWFIRSGTRQMQLPVLFLLISVFAVGATFETSYHVYYLPYAGIAIAVAASRFFTVQTPKIRLVARACFLLFLLNCTAFFAYLNYQFHVALGSETNYETFSRNIATRLPEGSSVCCWGEPSLAWGLWQQGKDFALAVPVFLNSQHALSLARDIDYVVLDRAFDPLTNMQGLNDTKARLAEVFQSVGRTMNLVDSVGTRTRFAYSAEIFAVHPERGPGVDRSTQSTGSDGTTQELDR